MSKATFFLLYLAFMVPTYVLPYFGSSSLLFQTGAGVLMDAPDKWPALLLHAGALVACGHIAAARGRLSGSKLSMEMAVSAVVVFDLTPLFSTIPFLSTCMHLFVLGKGLSGPDAYPTGEEPQGLASHPYIVLLGITVLTVAAATYVPFSLAKQVLLKVRAEKLSSYESSETFKKLTPSSIFDMQAPGPSSTTSPSEGMSQRTPTESGVINPYGRLYPSSHSGTSNSESGVGKIPADNSALETEREQALARKTAEENKKADRLAHIQKLNEQLEAPETAKMAAKYMENYIGYLAVEDTFGAMALFGADRVYTDELIAWVRKHRGISSVRYGHVQLVKSSDPLKPNRLRLTAEMTSVAISLGAPVKQSVVLLITLAEDGSKFVYVKPW